MKVQVYMRTVDTMKVANLPGPTGTQLAIGGDGSQQVVAVDQIRQNLNFTEVETELVLLRQNLQDERVRRETQGAEHTQLIAQV